MSTFASCVTETTLGIFADIFEILLSLPVQKGLDHRSEISHVWDIITEKDQRVPTPPQIGFDEGIVQLVAPKSPDVPE
jgi:hypothetical protein